MISALSPFPSVTARMRCSLRKMKRSAKAYGNVQVMDCNRRRQLPTSHYSPDQSHHLQLAAQIEVAGRLVQQENLRRLGECAGNGHLLTLPAAQGVHRPHGQVRQPQLSDDPFNQCVVII